MFKARKKENGGFTIELDIDGVKEKFDFVEPNFEVKAKAIEILLGEGETMHIVKAGKVIVDACYKGDITEVKSDDDVYVSLCAATANLVKVYSGELKKN